MSKLYSAGIGIGSLNSEGELLEVFYPQPLLNPSDEVSEALQSVLGSEESSYVIDSAKVTELAKALELAGESSLATLVAAMVESERPVIVCLLAEDAAPTDVAEAFLKLQLLSHRMVKPHGTNLNGVFGVLKNLAWTSEGAIDLTELNERQLAARCEGRVLQVNCIDKFPKMTDYVVPSGIRIADTARVRLGAYIGEGTTVMHEGFVNFNAGTDGPNMIEGRVSAGVFVGSGSDFGGGCSAMGTLSGGGDIVISVGQNCLIGANAGIGISLGDRCTVEAGLYITSGTKVTMLDDSGNSAGFSKANQLSGQSDLLFRRNSITGAVECLTNRSAVELNEELHAHN